MNAQINGREPPAGLDPDVAVEWHQALNWLLRHREVEWDAVSTDT